MARKNPSRFREDAWRQAAHQERRLAAQLRRHPALPSDWEQTGLRLSGEPIMAPVVLLTASPSSTSSDNVLPLESAA